ncbi:MAG: response regulator transcription factor [Burkholderiales bacterium]|nr:response regulator transcription factor [Burkholderiales bacterium]
MSAPIAVVVLEDEPLARRRVERLIATQPDLSLAGSYDNPLSARALLERVDLLFLDVEMPFEDGFAFLESLPAERRPYVIFTTAHERHAVRAFRHDAVDFLLKPFDREAFGEAVERARRRLRADALRRSAERAGGEGGAEVGGQAASTAPAPPVAVALLAVRVADGDASLLLAPALIDWIKVEGKAIYLSSGGRTYTTSGRLADFETRLAAHRFIRVHRAVLVNLDRIKAVQPRSHGDRTLILHDGQRIEMSRYYAAALDALTL